jgi:glycosyltransferase involved in cell wall biosynthesis
MRSPAGEVAFVLPDKLGGVFNYVDSLARHRHPDDFTYAAIRTDNARDVDTRGAAPLPVDREVAFDYSLPRENIHAVLRRLSRAIPFGPGVIVANGWLELALTSIVDTGRAVIAIHHGDFDYYNDLAVRHRDTIDAYVTYSDHMAGRLRALLPDRAGSVFMLPYGVDVGAAARVAAPGSDPGGLTPSPLRAMYAGRLSRDKGVFDLPPIDRRLRELGVRVAWTIQGTGADAEALHDAWSDRPDVRWTGLQPMAEVLRLYPTQDVLVMPSRAEGLPVALLEGGAAGVVPVISDLPSGIRDVVQSGVTGFLPPPGDINAFAEALSRLDRDRPLLESMSAAIRAHVANRYDATKCTAAYQALFARWRELKRPRPKRTKLPYGTRLDRPWIPNRVVIAVRSAVARRKTQ